MALVGVAIAIVIRLSFDLELYWPNGAATLFSFQHYLAPLVALICLGFIRAHQSRFDQIRLALSLSVILFFHFNFKLWAQLINPHLHDGLYQTIDNSLPHALALADELSQAFHARLFPWNDAYHDLFVLMFAVSIFAHGLFNPASLDRLITAIAAILLIGGLSYGLAPALGPFIYLPERTDAQSTMLSFHLAFIASHGESFSTGGFIMGIAAMPSLHVAHSLTLWWHAWRDIRILGWIYVPIVVFIVSEAVATHWHYLVDLPAGTAVAIISLILVNKLHQTGSHPPTQHSKSQN